MSTRLAVSGSNLTGDVPFSAALSTAAGTFVVRSPVGERGDLTRLCQMLCEQQGLAPEQIEEVIVDVGPGSYTGLRVAVTFVRFLQSFGSIPVQAVDSLALLAHHACARFEYRGGELVEVEAANATNTDQVLASLEPGERVVMPAAFAEQLGEQLRERNVEVIVARDLGADALFAPGLPLFSAKAEDLEPRYLMATYAED